MVFSGANVLEMGQFVQNGRHFAVILENIICSREKFGAKVDCVPTSYRFDGADKCKESVAFDTSANDFFEDRHESFIVNPLMDFGQVLPTVRINLF